uniref:Uncharacterized protein n=1 Tax=Tetranychus urticae TaxID=32264 RepID=T1KVC1_TETUR
MWGDKICQRGCYFTQSRFIHNSWEEAISLIESLAVGKPLNIDLGLGVKIKLHQFSGEKLLQAIEEVLNSEKISLNVARVSEELKKSDSSDKVVPLIEKLARNKSLC